jgi:hypothetical protein
LNAPAIAVLLVLAAANGFAQEAAGQKKTWGSLQAQADTPAIPVRTAARSGAVADNPELARIFRDDQADRQAGSDEINWAEVVPRDEERRGRVKKILDDGGAVTAADFFNAAMVFQHGNAVEDFRTANRLALRAVKLDPATPHAKWLAAASKDRELMNLGKPQLYGTQFSKPNGGAWELYDVDPSVTDEERAKWDVPPLAAARKRAADMNAAQE